MKKSLWFFNVAVVGLLVCSWVGFCFSKQKSLNIFTWANYVPASIIASFEAKTGIRVHIAVFDNNQVLYAKLKANPNTGYDVVIPSTYIVERLRLERMLQPLDLSQIPNFKYVDESFKNQSFDPDNQFSVPYLWGTSGIIVNTQKYYAKDFQSWKSLWQPFLKNQIGMSDDMRDNFSIALMVMGYSINDYSHLTRAYQKLQALKPNVKAFVANGSIQAYVNGDIDLGVVADGDAKKIRRQNSNFQFIHPKEGVKLWMDSMAIPKNAPNVKAAHQFINYVLQPDIAKQISRKTGFSSAMLPVKNIHGEFEGALSRQIEDDMLKHWERLKG